MTIPFSYSLRNLWARKLTTILTAAGMALVMFVFATVLMMSEGLQQTLVQTGSPDNVIVTRDGANTEVESVIERADAGIIETDPGVAIGADNQRMLSKEMVVLITLTKESTGVATNVMTRGVSLQSPHLRPQVKLIQGRMFRPGSAEIIAGSSIAERFPEAGLGGRMRFGQREWVVVGIFDAGKTGFDSEVWGDVDQLMQAFRRVPYSSVIFKLSDPSLFQATKQRIEADPRLKVTLKRESAFYAEQSEALATFIKYLGLTLSVVFSIGAMLGAMITMYAAVANRTAEIGTLRALGYGRSGILILFLLESLALSLIGGAVGLFCASFMQFLTVSTLNWQSFAELAFTFKLTPAIAAATLLFAAVMGIVGGVLPALRAARMKIVDALRAA
jgi:ABC-type lipoprotein release transport system permease subunit